LPCGNIRDGRPGRKHRPLGHGPAGEPFRRGFHDLQVERDALADTLYIGQQVRGRGENLGEGAEPPDQALGDRLHVPARDGPEQEEFDELVIGEALAPGLRETRAQPFAMAEVVRRLAGVGAHGETPS
jgi:hypothetical protein